MLLILTHGTSTYHSRALAGHLESSSDQGEEEMVYADHAQVVELV